MKKIFLIALFGLIALNSYSQSYDCVVAADGSGDFTKIQDAINQCKHFSTLPINIFIKNGVYNEKVEIPSWITGVVLTGEDRDKTVIINDDYTSKVTSIGVINTFRSYTLKISGNKTILRNLTVENNSPQLGQAVALHIEADGVFVDNCKLIGNQDTLYAGDSNGEALIENSYIEGTTDFIFGAQKLFIYNCTIHCKKDSYITAASTPEGKDFGFAILNCTITAADNVTKVYLGRPWRIYAQTVFLNCSMGDFILPQGWHNWSKPEAEATAFYAEFRTTGTSTAERVPWSNQLFMGQADRYWKELERLEKTIGIADMEN